MSQVLHELIQEHDTTTVNKTELQCDKCDYIATRVSNLKRHKKNKHGGKRYPCDKCDYKVARPYNLKSRKD